MNLVKVNEGKVEIEVPDFDDSEGPQEKGEGVFYNPSMEKSRDIFVSFLNSWADEKVRLLDGLAASGIRGIRAAKETPVSELTINDVSEKAVDLIGKNVEKNSVRAKVTHESIERHMLKRRYQYDYIDIDPFGPPVPYYPIAARTVSHEGVVGVTATDTAVLCGTYPKTCFRRYSSYPANNWCRHENGLRILLAYCAKEAARHNRWIKPLLSYYEGHHFRTYLQIGEGKSRADDCLNNLEKINFSKGRWESKEKGGGKTSGPFWTGPLFSRDILDRLDPLGRLDEKLISLWKSESNQPAFFYDTNEISSVLKVAPPPIYDIKERLSDKGFKSSRTHFSSTGIKTEAPYEEVKSIFLDLSS
ncbi:MAG: tRNA (guanine(26)-N(2))-dimethyltransferase [Candidatus Thermoplasmatota archaeon]